MSNQLLINNNFDQGTTGWSATGGFGAYSYYTSNQIAIDNGIAYFTYVTRTLSQVVDVSNIVSEIESFSCTLNIKHRQKGDEDAYTQVDVYNFELLFKDSSGNLLTSKRTPTTGNAPAPQEFTDINLELTRSEISSFNHISTIEVKITGLDTGFWNGNHGPMVDYVSLYSNVGSDGSGGSGGGGNAGIRRNKKFNNSSKLNRGLYKRFWNIYRDIRNF
jgi:hypothetical protein